MTAEESGTGTPPGAEMTVTPEAIADVGPAVVAAAIETWTEWGADCHGHDEPNDSTRHSKQRFTSRGEAERWAQEQIGQYGIIRYTIHRRLHYRMPDGCAIEYASGPWERDADGVTP